VRAPALAKLDDVAARTIAFALPALTLGIVVGVVRLEDRGGGYDALMAVTALTWTVYAGYLALRHFAGWRGRRAAYLVLAGFALVVVVRLALPVTHFT
jgi:ABC-type transport system involved in cytochrome c biogenesis permease subunit